MQYFDVVRARHSIRAYMDHPVEDVKLNEILGAVNSAPSAGNLQAFEIYVVTDRKSRVRLAEAAFHQDFIAAAPVVLGFCAHAARSSVRYGSRGADLYSIQDATIACTYAMLAATALGLSSVWVGAFDEDSVSKILKAPHTYRPVALLPVGYSGEEPRTRPRRPLHEYVHKINE